MLKDAKKLNKNKYTTNFKDTIFVIEVSNDKIKTISYLDQFDNKIKITFTQIQQNKNIDSSTFRAVFPLDYDIIQN
jgi:outer membrane lipoprotein-sorting protein